MIYRLDCTTKFVHRSLILVSAFALLLTVAGSASACVPQPYLAVIPRASGPAASQVTIGGENFSGRTEIRWNSLDGPLLATSSDTSFTVPIVIPDVPEGLYTIVALTRETGGGVGGSSRTLFQVSTSGTAAVVASPEIGHGSHGANDAAVYVSLTALVLAGVAAALSLATRRRINASSDQSSAAAADRG